MRDLHDTAPRDLANGLDALAQQILPADREVAQILTTARDELLALAWNRCTRHMTLLCGRQHFAARHKQHGHRALWAARPVTAYALLMRQPR